MIPTPDQPTWEAPGPGAWRSLADHLPGSVTPIYAELHARATASGFAAMFESLGVPVATLTEAHVHGHTYVQLRPLIMAGRDAPLPPRAAVWAMARLHPAFRRRSRTARRVLTERPWLEAPRVWAEQSGPQRQAVNAGLAGVALETLNDAELWTHVRDCIVNLEDGHRLHFEMHGPDMAPVGLLLAAGRTWGLDQVDLLDALGASSPASGAMNRHFDALRRAVRAAGVEPGTLAGIEELRAVSPEVAGLLDALMAERGWCLVTSYDLDGRALVEVPELILAGIARPAPPTRPATDTAGRIAALRERVPARERERFDLLAGDALATYGLRDENGPHNVQIPAGLLRRALLEVGRRLAGREQIADPAHIFEMSLDEVRSFLSPPPTMAGPSASDLAGRARRRSVTSAFTPPATLGPETPDVPIEALPPALGAMSGAMILALESVQGGGHPLPLCGDGIGTEVVRGRACVASDAADALARLEPGDILVTTTTTPAHNALLALVGGLVAAQGGQFSHSAIMARELGLSAVVGVAGAAEHIASGDLIEIDPRAGVVAVIAQRAVQPPSTTSEAP
ncbi:MAG: PEP-utilizing enzyme [Acidimicrobiales bacterium]